MLKIIKPDGRKLLLDFSFFVNVVFKNNSDGLDKIIKNLNISGVDSIESFFSFLNASIVKKAYICLFSNSPRKLKNKEVFDGIVRVYLDDESQSKINDNNKIGFTFDIDPNRPTLSVSNIFLTRLSDESQAFETEIDSCEITSIKFSNQLSTDEVFSTGFINSESLKNIIRISNGFLKEYEKWTTLLNFESDLVELKRRKSVLFIKAKNLNLIKVPSKKIDKDNLPPVLTSSKNYLYFDLNNRDILDNKNLNYELVNVKEFSVVVDNETDLRFLSRANSLTSCELKSNLNCENYRSGDFDIKNLFKFEYDNDNSPFKKIDLGKNIFLSKNKTKFLDYWKSANDFFLNGKNVLNSNLKKNKELLNNLFVRKVLFEIENEFQNNIEYGYILDLNIGEEVLINRKRTSLKNIMDAKSKNPYLINYLFNTKLVKYIKEKEINLDDYNFKFKLNDSQKKAVVNAINSKDFFIIQGPPGTGKTQVISEIAYQLSKLGRKVLITSQNHEAINNVIDRLPLDPNINKIRLSTTYKNENFYSPEKVTINYYRSLHNTIESDLKYTPKKSEDLKLIKEQIEKAYSHYIQHYEENEKVKDLNSRLEKLYEEQKNIEKRILDYKQENYHTEELEYIIDDLIYSLTNDYYEPSQLSNPVLEEKIFSSIYKILYDFAESYNIPITVKDPLQQVRVFREKIFPKQYDLFLKMKEELENNPEFLYNGDYNKDKSSVEIFFKNIKAEKSLKEFENLKINILNKLNELKNNIKDSEQNKELNKYNDLLKSIEIKINDLNIKKNHATQIISKVKDFLILVTKSLKDDYKFEIDFNSSFTGDQLKQELCKIDKNIEEIKKRKAILTPVYNKIVKYSKSVYGDLLNDTDGINQYLMRDVVKYTNTIISELVNVYAMTLTSNNLFKFDKSDQQKDLNITDINLKNVDLEYVIIDEASKATMLEILMPLIYGKVLILVGDYRQLPPILSLQKEDVEEVNKEFKKNYDYKTLYDTIDKSIFKELISANNGNITTILDEQYRSHKDIADIINYFYDNQLKTDLNISNHKEHNLTVKNYSGIEYITNRSSAYWIDSTFNKQGEYVHESREDNSTSMYNENEINITKKIVEDINKSVKEKKLSYKPSLAVISFYGLHVKKIKHELQKIDTSAIDLVINTVDDFQGKESDFVIVNLVRNPKNLNPNGRQFLRKYERINVAFSRARKLLVIVGSNRAVSDLKIKLPRVSNPNEYTISNVYTKIIDKLKQKKSFIESNIVLEE